MERQN